MSFLPTSLRPQPRPPRPFSVCFRQTPNGERFTPRDDCPSSLLSRSYKRLCPQPFSFDSHTNAPGRSICTSNQTFLKGRTASRSFALHTRSFAVRGNSSPFFSIAPHSLRKQPGCTPTIPYPEAFRRGANLGIEPSFLPTFRLRYTRRVASRSPLPWTSASPRRTPPSPI